MQQQHADYDLLAVFSDETAANTAAAKLQKEGFSTDEVFQIAPGATGSGEFREHGPNRNRGDIFLQRQRARPNLRLILLLAIAFGLVFGAAGFLIPLLLIAIHLLATAAIQEPLVGLVTAGVGIVVGAITGFFQRGRVRGDIGQSATRTSTPTRPVQGARTAIALRLPDAEDISRKSRARAILLNNGGKIDRSVGRTE